MAKRTHTKVRHYKPVPTFSERVSAGQKGEMQQLWERYGWIWNEEQQRPTLHPIAPVVSAVVEKPVSEEPEEHVHGEHCNHEGHNH